MEEELTLRIPAADAYAVRTALHAEARQRARSIRRAEDALRDGRTVKLGMLEEHRAVRDAMRRLIQDLDRQQYHD